MTNGVNCWRIVIGTFLTEFMAFQKSMVIQSFSQNQLGVGMIILTILKKIMVVIGLPIILYWINIELIQCSAAIIAILHQTLIDTGEWQSDLCWTVVQQVLQMI